MSKFTTKVLRALAENIAGNNYKVTLFCAGKDLQINLQDAKAIGFASPVYAGLIRPPLSDFIQRNEFSGTKCFVVLTGGSKESIDVDTAKAAKLIEEKGGKIIGREKFITSDKEDKLQEKIKLFSKELIDKL
jgi:flavorubredoxin